MADDYKNIIKIAKALAEDDLKDRTHKEVYISATDGANYFDRRKDFHIDKLTEVNKKFGFKGLSEYNESE